jgi:diphthine-ammonia ligase
MHDIGGRPLFCSWSGGTAGYRALTRAVRAGGRPRALLTMLHEDGADTRGHGLPLRVIERQAEALGLALVTRPTTWDGYEAAFLDALVELRATGLTAGVFGDIDLEPHREWVTRVCATAGLGCYLPLWQESRRALIDEFVGDGAQATIIAVRLDRLDPRFLGRELTAALVTELEAAGVDVCGEEGEYHTIVTGGSLFAAPLTVSWHSETERDGCRLLVIDSNGSRS